MLTLTKIAVLTLVIAFCLFLLGQTLGKKITSKTGRSIVAVVGLMLAIPGCIYVVYYLHLFDGAAWYYRLRILPYADLLPAGLGFSGGLIFSLFQPEFLSQRVAIPLITLIGVLIPFAKSIVDPLDYPRLSTECANGVCLQSTPSTCGPSSAATILRMYGDAASERDLAQAAFTSRGGTEIWYLARALQRRGYKTQVIIQSSENPLPTLPAIAGVTLSGGGGHFIALLNESHGQVTIADPLKGKFQVPRVGLSKAYRFSGFFLTVQRE